MARHLIVTADDFGLSRQVNAAVEASHRDGILTAASLMVGAPAADDAVHLARDPADASGRPASGARRRQGRCCRPNTCRTSSVRTAGSDAIRPGSGPRSSSGRVSSSRWRARSRRSSRPMRRTGLPLDHVDAHQHFHLHPTIAGSMIRIGRRFGMRAVRIPAEPTGIIRAIDPGAPRATPAVVAPWTALLGRRLRAAGFFVPDQVFGLAWTGAMTTERIAGPDRAPSRGRQPRSTRIRRPTATIRAQHQATATRRSSRPSSHPG